jgi:3-methylcrotonyl-CoA carboxylase alpha subunit
MAQDGNDYSVKLGDQAVHGSVRRDGDMFHVFVNGAHYPLAYNDPMAHAGEAEAEGGRLTAPMPGKVVAVLAAKGQEVRKGDALVIMEAMKMEHTIAAPHDGVIDDVLYSVGDQVADGAPLLAFKTA